MDRIEAVRGSWAQAGEGASLGTDAGIGPRLRLVQDAAGALQAAVVAPSRNAEAAALVADLKARTPGLPVLVELTAADAGELRALLEAGADAVIAAGMPARAVRAVASALGTGAPVACATASSRTEESFGLTAREVEVLRFLSSGFSNKEVARRLDVSVRTVETHRFNLRRKTQAGRLKDLVHLARRMGLPPAGETDAWQPARRLDYAGAGAQA